MPYSFNTLSQITIKIQNFFHTLCQLQQFSIHYRKYSNKITSYFDLRSSPQPRGFSDTPPDLQLSCFYSIITSLPTYSDITPNSDHGGLTAHQALGYGLDSNTQSEQLNVF